MYFKKSDAGKRKPRLTNQNQWILLNERSEEVDDGRSSSSSSSKAHLIPASTKWPSINIAQIEQ